MTKHKHRWRKIEVLGVKLEYCLDCEALRDAKGKETKEVTIQSQETEGVERKAN